MTKKYHGNTGPDDASRDLRLALDIQARLDSLTEEESAVLEPMLRGSSTVTIGGLLRITEDEAVARSLRVMDKMQAKDHPELVRLVAIAEKLPASKADVRVVRTDVAELDNRLSVLDHQSEKRLTGFRDEIIYEFKGA